MIRRLCFAAAFLLAACAGQTAMDRATLLEQSYTGAETFYLGYLQLPDCDRNPKPCSEDETVERISPLNERAFNAVQEYRDAIFSGQPDSVLQELLIAAQAAINALRAETIKLPTASVNSSAVPTEWADYVVYRAGILETRRNGG